MLTHVVLWSSAVLRSSLDKRELKCLLSTCHVLNTLLAAVQTASQLTFTQPIKVDIIVPALWVWHSEKLGDLPEVPQVSLMGGSLGFEPRFFWVQHICTFPLYIFKNSMYMYMAIYEMDNQQKYHIAHGTQFNVIYQPGWEEGLGQKGFMYMYGWVPSLFT